MRFTRTNIAIVIGFIIVVSSCNCKVEAEFDGPNYAMRVVSNTTSSKSTRQSRSGYHQIWPEMEFGWKIVVGTIITMASAALGSVGGAGGDGQFVPMLSLIIGFDQKSAVALSKCMIFGGAATTVLYNLRQRHEESPVIDYNLALLFNPLMILGTSMGVVLNVFLAGWMLTVLLIIVLLVASTKSFLKGIKTWKKETLLKKDIATRIQPVDIELPNIGNSNDHQEVEINDSNNIQAQSVDQPTRIKVSFLENVYWKELGIIFVLWTVVLILQIAKTNATACSMAYWVFDYSQMPATIGVSLYQAVCLYKGYKVIASKRDTNYQVRKLIGYCSLGILAGIFSGMLGVGGGVMLSPLFLHLGIPPQVSSATATLIMVFSSSMTVVEYRLLKRFPVPYALFFAAVSAVSAILGQAVIGKMIRRSGRRSVIIFILASLMLLSIAGVGGVGIARSIKKIQHNEYMGFEDICSY